MVFFPELRTRLAVEKFKADGNTFIIMQICAVLGEIIAKLMAAQFLRNKGEKSFHAPSNSAVSIKFPF